MREKRGHEPEELTEARPETEDERVEGAERTPGIRVRSGIKSGYFKGVDGLNGK